MICSSAQLKLTEWDYGLCLRQACWHCSKWRGSPEREELPELPDEYRIKPVEEVKYMKNGAEEEQKIAARKQENLEKSASSNIRLKTNKEIPGLVHQPRANIHISESQQEFFRMLDEKLKRVEISVRKKKISHSTNPTTQTGSYYCVNRLHLSWNLCKGRFSSANSTIAKEDHSISYAPLNYSVS